MNHFDAKTMGKRMADFGYAEATFRALSGTSRAYPKALKEFKKALERGVQGTQRIGMNSARAHCADVLKLMGGSDLPAATLMAHAQRAKGAIQSDLAERKFLYIPVSLAEYLDQEQLFGERVWKQFPKARHDIREAGNCLAADCNTAAVFSLMRVAEHGLRAIAKKLKANPLHKGASIPLEYADWNKVITAIRTEITAARGKGSPTKEKQLNFYSDISEQAEWIKDLYRNDVSHTRKNYNSAEALGAMLRIKAFMARLGTDLRLVK